MIPFPPPAPYRFEKPRIGAWLRRWRAARLRRRWTTVAFRPPVDPDQPWLCQPVPHVLIPVGQPSPVVCVDLKVDVYTEPVHPVSAVMPLHEFRHVHVVYTGEIAYAVVMPCGDAARAADALREGV